MDRSHPQDKERSHPGLKRKHGVEDGHHKGIEVNAADPARDGVEQGGKEQGDHQEPTGLARCQRFFPPDEVGSDRLIDDKDRQDESRVKHLHGLACKGQRAAHAVETHDDHDDHNEGQIGHHKKLVDPRDGGFFQPSRQRARSVRRYIGSYGSHLPNRFSLLSSCGSAPRCIHMQRSRCIFLVGHRLRALLSLYSQ